MDPSRISRSGCERTVLILMNPGHIKKTKHGAAVLLCHHAHFNTEVFCGQWLTLNIPRADVEQLKAQECARFPCRFKWLTACIVLASDTRCDEEAMRRMCQVRGLKPTAIDFQLKKWRSNKDLIRLFLAGCDTCVYAIPAFLVRHCVCFKL